MIIVKATFEGLEGHPTADRGWLVDDRVSFVALPSVKALDMHVRIWNPATDLSAVAEVLDVGPWDEHDDLYVFQPKTEPQQFTMVVDGEAVDDGPEVRPLAESGKDTRGRTTNHAGIDLGEKVRKALGPLSHDGQVGWQFL